jgi:hypothetical protein
VAFDALRAAEKAGDLYLADALERHVDERRADLRRRHLSGEERSTLTEQESQALVSLQTLEPQLEAHRDQRIAPEVREQLDAEATQIYPPNDTQETLQFLD